MKLIDITMEIYVGMPVLPVPWYPTPEVSLVLTREKDLARRVAHKLTMLTHTATHIDAPVHYIEGGKSLDEIPINVFVGDAVVATMFHKAPKGRITAEDLEKAVGLKVREGDALIIRTGWTTRMHGKPEYFTDSPVLTKDAAEWIVEKKIRMVVIDFQTDTMEEVGSTAPIHRTLLSNGVLIVEYVTSTELITKDRVKLIALPLKIRGIEAAPARVLIEE